MRVLLSHESDALGGFHYVFNCNILHNYNSHIGPIPHAAMMVIVLTCMLSRFAS
jgi:hypothetical protein